MIKLFIFIFTLFVTSESYSFLRKSSTIQNNLDVRRALTDVDSVYDYMNIHNTSYIEVYSKGGDFDDTHIIQSAICYIKGISGNDCGDKSVVVDNSLYTSGTIRLVSSLYNINSNIEIYSNIVLEGMGVYRTNIRLQNNTESFYEDPDHPTSNNGVPGFIRTTNQDNIIIRDVTIDGNKYNQLEDSVGDDRYSYGRFGIYFEGVNNIEITNMRIINCQGYGVYIRGKNTVVSNKVKIINSVLDGNGIDGIILERTQYSLISNNIVQNNDKHGINIAYGSKQIIVTKNTLINNGYDSDGCGIITRINKLILHKI